MVNDGISDGSTYFYEGRNLSCRRTFYPAIHKISNFCEVELEDNEENLKRLVGTVGPVAAVITTTEGLYNYGDGVFYDPTCDPNAFDHAIVKSFVTKSVQLIRKLF